MRCIRQWRSAEAAVRIGLQFECRTDTAARMTHHKAVSLTFHENAGARLAVRINDLTNEDTAAIHANGAEVAIGPGEDRVCSAGNVLACPAGRLEIEGVTLPIDRSDWPKLKAAL